MPDSSLTSQQILRKQEMGEPVYSDADEHVHRHIIMVMLENHLGALNRVINLFSQRGFNLESVAVGETNDPAISRLTLVTTGNDRIIKQVLRQLNNLVDTLAVEDLTAHEYVERELLLLRVRYTELNRPAIMNTADIFRAKVVDITTESMTFQVTGPTKKVNAFLGLMAEYGILEVARSGRIAMKRALVFGD
ncbi:MAG: acetolactate synthase small subunit [Bacteroidota bacterium]